MAEQSKKTKDLEIIKKWAEERGGRPTKVKGTGDTDSEDDLGIIRIDFPDENRGNNLEEISWERFMQTFNKKNLTFLYQETTPDGKMSRFNKFVKE